MNFLHGIQQFADGFVFMQTVYKECNILAHIDFAVPGTVQKLLGTVDQVGGEDLVQDSCGIGFIEFFN